MTIKHINPSYQQKKNKRMEKNWNTRVSRVRRAKKRERADT
jgi:hypothetical protein